ncbi:MAG TPA: phosphoribosylformylglycinamidine synthase, partial [Pirellulales bacterium]
MTLWEIDLHPAAGEPDLLARTILSEAADLGLGQFEARGARGFLVQGDVSQPQVERIARELIADLVVEVPLVGKPGEMLGNTPLADSQVIHVLPKPGVTDPVAASTLAAIEDFGIAADAVVTLRKYWISGLNDAQLHTLATKLLANDSIEQVVFGPLKIQQIHLGSPYRFEAVTLSIRSLDDDALLALSKQRT